MHKDTFEHVVATVFGLPTDNDMWKAFVYDMGSENLLDIYRLTGMAPIDVPELDFKPNKWAKMTVPLSRGLRSNITVFQAVHQECQKKSDWTPEKILTLTFDEFDEFRVEHQTQYPGSTACQSGASTCNANVQDATSQSMGRGSSGKASSVTLLTFRQSRI